MDLINYLIIGSGMSSVHAAQTLIENGQSISMIDVGTTPKTPDNKNGKSNFYDIRKKDKEQYKIFIGDDLSGINYDDNEVVFTPSRKYIISHVNDYLPYDGHNFNLTQSLSRGGLGNAWGAGAAPYTRQQIELIGLKYDELCKSYKEISKRILLSGKNDDSDGFFSKNCLNLEAPLKQDKPILMIYDSYNKNKNKHNSNGIYFGRTPIAITAKGNFNRNGHLFRNMEFYDDVDQGVYRPWMTIDELNDTGNLNYINNSLVLTFEEKEDFILVKYIDLSRSEVKEIRTKKLLIGAGAINSARIILRSFNSSEQLPILTNSYSTKAFIHIPSLGTAIRNNNNSLGQLEIFYETNDNDPHASMSSLYTYSSLMLSRLITKPPFMGMIDSFKALSLIQSSIIISSFNHPDIYSDNNYIRLAKYEESVTKDRVIINYSRKHLEKKDNKATFEMSKALFRCGCIQLAHNKMLPGSAVHYAGTMPFNDKSRKFYLDTNGKLSGTKNIYVVDSSGFKFLPANGLSLTLMANASLVAKKVLQQKLM